MCRDEGIPERIKGTVMSAFYWGYGVSQIPGGFLAQRYGGRRMLIACFTCWCTICCFLMPQTASNISGMIAARVLIGVSQGFLIPSVHTVLSEWVLPHERAKATSLTTSGMYLGSAAAMQHLPALARAWGSPVVILRAVGALGYLWLAIWLLVGRDVRHRTGLIPVTARDEQRDGGSGDQRKSVPATPTARLLRHPAVWAIVINNFTFHYAFYIVMNWMPTYFSSLIGTDLDRIGFGKPVPYVCMFVMSNVGGWMGDWLIGCGYAVGPARKIVNSLGFWGMAVLLVAMPMARSVFQGLVLLTACLGVCGLARGGFSVNHMDIAPKYAGVVMGISNTAGTISGVIGVAITGYILEAAGGSAAPLGWFQAHFLAAGLGVAGSMYFIFAARGNRLFN